MDTTDIPAEPGTPIRDAPPADTSTPALVSSTSPPADEVPPSPARPFWRDPYLLLAIVAVVLYWRAALRRP